MLALQYGFQLTGTRPSRETVQAEVRSAVSQVMAVGKYREVCLVGKSIGAGLAVGAAAELTEIRTSLILLTPGLSALGPARAPTLAVIGTAAPVYETPDCQGALQRGDTEWLVLNGLNHGLASRDDWTRSLEALSRVLPACERFLLSWL